MSETPNILLIMTDQHRLSALGAYGDTPCKTPNLDALAKEGILFENAYTSCPVCSPARGTVMTGKYPHAHGITTNIHEMGCGVGELPDGPDLLSRRLQTAGYHLGYSGKWHLGTNKNLTRFGEPNTPSLPKDVGFEGQNFPGHGGGGFNYPEYRQYLRDNGFSHSVLPWDEGTKTVWPAGKLKGPEESTVPYFLTENTLGMIDDFSSRGDPFFIWHNFWGPHGPFHVPGEFVEMYRNVDIPQWPNYEWPAREISGPHHSKIHPEQESLSWSDWEMAIRYYYAFATLIDKQIGRMMEHLEKSGLKERTMVVFTADHGQTLGSHGGLTDKGWHHFEETHRIPFIVRMPGGAHAGKTVEHLISLTDLYPTALDYAGAETPPDVHGRSLRPLIEGGSETPWRDHVATEFNGLANSLISQRALRSGNWKYGFNNTGDDELYDLSADPWEMNNLAGDPKWSDQLRAMIALMLRWMEDTDDPLRRRFLFEKAPSLGIEVNPTT